MGQDIVARDEVELHGGCVVLQGQQALPHDRVFLLTGNKADMGSWHVQHHPGNSSGAYRLGDWGTFRTQQSQGVKSSFCPSYLQKLNHIHRPL